MGSKKSYSIGYYVTDPERYGVAEFNKDGGLFLLKKPQNLNQIMLLWLIFLSNNVVKNTHIQPSARAN